MSRSTRWTSSALLLTALGLAAGCNDINSGQDQRNGRGEGDQVPAQGGGSMGTNASAKDVTTEGPGSHKVISNDTPPGISTPYGGNGAGATPPVSPAQGEAGSGEANSGQKTAKQGNIGSDASTNNATSQGNNGGPGSGQPPK